MSQYLLSLTKKKKNNLCWNLQRFEILHLIKKEGTLIVSSYEHSITNRGNSPNSKIKAKIPAFTARLLFSFPYSYAMSINMAGIRTSPITKRAFPIPWIQLAIKNFARIPHNTPPSKVTNIAEKIIVFLFIISFHLTLFPVSMKCVF